MDMRKYENDIEIELSPSDILRENDWRRVFERIVENEN